MAIDFWFEFASTYSYPSAMRVEGLAQRRGIKVVWRPFLLGPIFNAQGWNNSPFNLYPVKGAYMWRDLERICTRLGIAYKKPGVFPRSGLLAARVVCTHSSEGWAPDFIRSIYRANFAEDLDIASEKVVTDCLLEAGADVGPVLERASSEAGKAELRKRTAEAAALGIFGAPTFMVNGEMFWGHDRLDQALDWCEAHSQA